MAKVSNKQILNIFQVLSKLDPGLDEKNRTKSLFNFKAKASYALARNYRKLRSTVDDLEKVRVDTFKKFRTGEEETLTGDNAKKFNVEFTELLETQVDFTFYTVEVADLELEKNSITVDVLAELLDTIVVGEVA